MDCMRFWRCSRRLVAALVLLAVAAVIGGCAVSPGADRLPSDHFAFNDAIELAESREMLLNIVRNRYADPIKFLSVGTLGSSFSVGVEVEGEVEDSGGTLTRALTPAVAYSESPTLTFVPRGDSAFAMNLLSPVSMSATLLALRFTPNFVMEAQLAISEINGAIDEPGSAGQQYRARLATLAAIVEKGEAWLGITRAGESLAPILVIGNPGSSAAAQAASVLGLTPGLSAYRVNSSAEIGENGRDGAILYLSMRSVAEMLSIMAAGVQVPAQHAAAGITPPLDWFPARGSDYLLFRVESGAAPPGDRLSVRHRGYWFWISDSDLASKSAFLSLLTYFNVQAGADIDPAAAPVLTIPVGR